MPCAPVNVSANIWFCALCAGPQIYWQAGQHVAGVRRFLVLPHALCILWPRKQQGIHKVTRNATRTPVFVRSVRWWIWCFHQWEPTSVVSLRGCITTPKCRTRLGVRWLQPVGPFVITPHFELRIQWYQVMNLWHLDSICTLRKLFFVTLQSWANAINTSSLSAPYVRSGIAKLI